jgi:hypothetical protein
MSPTASELEYYRNLVAKIIDNDAEKKKMIDERVRTQIAMVKQQLPDADDNTLIVFLISVAFMIAKIMATPLVEAADLTERIFDNNVIAAAVVMGAYDLDSDEMPQATHHHPESEESPIAPMSPEEFEQFTNRQYL